MDGMTALASILAAGATAAAKDVAGQAVKDLYAGLKAAIGALIDRPEKVEELEKNPEASGTLAEVAAELRSAGTPPGEEVANLAAQLAAALAEIDETSRERAGIEIGAIVAAQNAILKDFNAEGAIRIESVTASGGDAVISGLAAGGGSQKD